MILLGSVGGEGFGEDLAGGLDGVGVGSWIVGVCPAGPLAFHFVEVYFGRRCRVPIGNAGGEPALPAGKVEVAQEALPFAVGVVVESTLVGGFAASPGGYLHSGVPLVKGFIFRRRGTVAGLLQPSAEAEVDNGAKQGILKLDKA